MVDPKVLLKKVMVVLDTMFLLRSEILHLHYNLDLLVLAHWLVVAGGGGGVYSGPGDRGIGGSKGLTGGPYGGAGDGGFRTNSGGRGTDANANSGSGGGGGGGGTHL